MDQIGRTVALAVGIVLLTAAAGLAVARAGDAQSPLEQAKRDDIAIVPDNDPAMDAAMTKARATLADFLALAAAPKPDMTTFSVKIGIRDGAQVEYFWITPFTNDNGRFSGVIDGVPRMVRSVKLGQTVSFTRSDIVDWMYIDGQNLKGNFTACALLTSKSRAEAEEFKKKFGLNCDF